MALQVNRVTNANVYLNGANLLGRAKKVDLPVIKQMMADHKGLGMVGQIELPARGVEKMEATFEWESFYAEVMRLAGNPNQAVQLQVRCSIDTYTGAGLTEEKALVVSLSGVFKEMPLGSLAQHEGVSYATKLAVYYVKVVADGDTLLEVDVMNNIYNVAGNDILARFRSIIGG
jgi:P2 family phage contractile tail tube protein